MYHRVEIRKAIFPVFLCVLLAFVSLCAIPIPAAQAAGTTYYVDSVGGNDANSGTSSGSPWKTLSTVNTMTFSPGDIILLKAGSVFTDQYLDLKGSGSSGNPIVVDMYGTGAKPLINFGNTSVGGEGFGVRLKNVSYWEINNLEIASGQYSTDMRRHGVLVVGEGTGAGDFYHIYLKNLYIHDVFGTDRRTGGINFHARGSNTDPESTWTDVRIENNTVSNVADTGIQTMTDAYFNSSWTHKFDAFKNLVIDNNYVEKIHRDGILVRAGQSPLIEYNTTDKIGTYCDVDTSIVNYLDPISVVAAQWSYYTTGAIFQYNEASETKRIDADGQPWDFDVAVSNSIYQYNYSHDNQGGTLLNEPQSDNNIFRYNISQNDLDIQGAFSFYQGTGTLNVYNNDFYRSLSQNTPLTNVSSSTNNVYYTNNIFYNMANSTYSTSSHAIYSNNLFYGNHSSQPNDPNKIVTDPKFVNPGGALSRATADAYKLQFGSPAIDSGTNIVSNGGQDFFGNTLYNELPDRGAYEYQPSSDTQAPTAPANLTAAPVSASQIDLSWTASTDNVGVSGYDIYRNGVLVGTATATSFQDSGLAASTAYSYYVEAYDAAGNLSANSNTAGATTLNSTVLFQDDFEDGDAAGWTAVSGTWSVATDGTNVYSQTSTSGEAIAYAGNSTWTDYTYEAKVKLNTSFGNAGLVYRYADASNFYMFRLNNNGGKVELYKRVGGTFTLVASAAQTVSIGQFYTLKVVTTGNNMIGYVDGVEKINWTDSVAELSSGQIGFRMSSSAAKFDDVKVTQ
jgi:chitodextrinase